MVRELKHTEIGDIPVDWEIQTFEETFKILSNNTLSRENLNNRDGAVRNIHYGDVLTQFSEVLKCNDEEIPYINDLSLLSSSTQLLQDGDTIIADTAEDETVGKATEIQGLGNGKLVAGLHTIPCRVKKGEFAPGWHGYYMNSHMYHDQIIPYITGIKVSSISKSAVAETLILIPSKEEQEAIVKSLQDVDLLILSLEKEIAKKKNIKYGVLQSYVTGKRRIDGFSSKWEEKTIDELCTLVTKQTGFDYSAEIKPSLVEVHYSNTLPFLQNKDFAGYSINYNTDFYIPTEVAYKYPKIFLDNICLLISISGRIGNVAMFNHDRDAFVGGAVGVAKFKNPELVEWTMLYLMGTDGQKQIFENEKAGAQHNLTVEDVRHLTIPIPGDDERKAITAMMSDIEEDIIHLEHKLEKYKMLKQGMMSDLLTGKIRLV